MVSITIPSEKTFYSLYADGQPLKKEYDTISMTTKLLYADDARILLYYTYPMHRRIYLIWHSPHGTTRLPEVSEPVTVIFKHFASRVDKTRRAMAYISTHYQSAFLYPIAFYRRLDVVIAHKGPLNYGALDALCHKEYAHGHFC